MREYLRGSERNQLLYFKKYIDNIEIMLDKWKNNLSKEEAKDLKTAKTWGLKAYESILNRQNRAALTTFSNSVKESYVQVVDKFSVDMYNRKIMTSMDASYEENKDYFRLIELMMELNCKNCTKCGGDCEVYQELESHCIPSPTGELEQNCKYAYRK